MAEPTFDVLFSGELFGAATEEHVKQRMAQTFRLDQAGVDSLFSGKQVFVKRGVDRVTAERFREAFHKLGALAEIKQVGGAPEELFRFDDSDDEAGAFSAPQPAGSAAAPRSTPGADSKTQTPSNAAWSVAPPGAALEEISDLGPEQNPDISKLSLVQGDDWSLEDCAPPPLAEQIPDIDSMEIEPQSTLSDKSQEP